MGQINVILPDELEEKLRIIAAKKFGFKRGALKKAVIEAIEKWVEENRERLGE